MLEDSNNSSDRQFFLITVMVGATITLAGDDYKIDRVSRSTAGFDRTQVIGHLTGATTEDANITIASGTTITFTNPDSIDVDGDVIATNIISETDIIVEGDIIVGGDIDVSNLLVEGAINLEGISAGTIADNSVLGLNSSNQVVLGAGGTSIDHLSSADAGTVEPDNAPVAFDWPPVDGRWNVTSSFLGLTTANVAAIPLGATVNLPITRTDGSTATQTFRVIEISANSIILATVTPGDSDYTSTINILTTTMISFGFLNRVIVDGGIVTNLLSSGDGTDQSGGSSGITVAGGLIVEDDINVDNLYAHGAEIEFTGLDTSTDSPNLRIDLTTGRLTRTTASSGIGIGYTFSDSVTVRVVGTAPANRAVIEFSSAYQASKFFRLLPAAPVATDTASIMVMLGAASLTFTYVKADVAVSGNDVIFDSANPSGTGPFPVLLTPVVLSTTVAATGVDTINETGGNVDLSWDAEANTFSANVDLPTHYKPGDSVILEALFANESSTIPVPYQEAESDAVKKAVISVAGFQLLPNFAFSYGTDQNSVHTFTYAHADIATAHQFNILEAKGLHYAVGIKDEQVVLVYTSSSVQESTDLVYNVLGWYDRGINISSGPIITEAEIADMDFFVLDLTEQLVTQEQLQAIRNEIPANDVLYTTQEAAPFIADVEANIPQHLNSRSTIRIPIRGSDGHSGDYDSVLTLAPGVIDTSTRTINTETAWMGATYTCFFTDAFAFGNTGSDYYTTPTRGFMSSTVPGFSPELDGSYYYLTTASTSPPAAIGLYVGSAADNAWIPVPRNTLGLLHLDRVTDERVGDGTTTEVHRAQFSLMNEEALLHITGVPARNAAYGIPAHRTSGNQIGIYVPGSEDTVTIRNAVLAIPDPPDRARFIFRHEQEAIDFAREGIGSTNSFNAYGVNYVASQATRTGSTVEILNAFVEPDFADADGSIHDQLFTSMDTVNINATPTSEVILEFTNGMANEFFQRDLQLFQRALPPSGPVLLEVNNHYYWFDDAAVFYHSESNNLNSVFYNLGRGGFRTTLPNAQSGLGELRVLNAAVVTTAFTANVDQGAFFRRIRPSSQTRLTAGDTVIDIDQDMNSVTIRDLSAADASITILESSAVTVPTLSKIGTLTYVDLQGTSTLVVNPVNMATDITGQVPTANIADDAINQAKLGNNSVGAAQLINGAVTGEKIIGGAIEAVKLANNAVTTEKIIDGAVTAAKGGRLRATKELGGNSFLVSDNATQAGQTVTVNLEDGFPVLGIAPNDLYIIRVYDSARAREFHGVRFFTTGVVNNLTGTFGMVDDNTLDINVNGQVGAALFAGNLLAGNTITFEKFDSATFLTGGFLLRPGAPFDASTRTYVDTTGRFYTTNELAAETVAEPRGLTYFQRGNDWFIVGQEGGTPIISF